MYHHPISLPQFHQLTEVNATQQDIMASTEKQLAEKLHPLDLGVARFTEFSMTVILTEWINADFYKEKLKELSKAWPVLSTRMDRIVSDEAGQG